MFEVTIQPLPRLRVAALAHHGPYSQIGGTFQKLVAWAGTRGLLRPETRVLGLYRDNPNIVPPKHLRSDAAITVPEGAVVDGGLRLVELPAGRAAVLLFRGPYAELEHAYEWLFGEWLPASGEEPADAPVREEYLNDCRSLPPADWLTAIMLPLK